MNIFQKAYKYIVLLIGKVQWTPRNKLLPTDCINIRNILVKDYCIILTRRSNHLSTFFVNLADFFLTFKWGYWSHALLNLEDEVKSDDDFRLMEATGSGVHYTTFDNVFDVQSTALLIPKSMSPDKWTVLLDRAKLQLGKPYDTLFDIADSRSLSCIELVRFVLQGEPNYLENFGNFEALIRRYKNLSPQMLFDCGDFNVIYIVKN